MTYNLRPYQHDAYVEIGAAWTTLHRSIRGPRILLVSRTGCHARGQGVLMFDGSVRPVETVLPGDRLMGPDSSPRTVLALARGRGPMARIVPVKGQPFVVNDEHVLSLMRTGGEGSVGGEIIDITVNEWRTWSAHRKHLYKLFRVGVGFQPSAHPLPIDPYFLGVLLGDGSIKRHVAVTTTDVEIRAEVEKQATEWGLRVRDEGITAHVVGSKGDRNPLTRALQRLRVFGCGSGSKWIPEVYKLASRAERLALLAGLIDTDGHLDVGGYDYISKSPQLAADVAFVARSLGLAAYVRSCTKGSQTGSIGTYHRVSISGPCSIVPCRLPRKRAADRLQKKSALRTSFGVDALPVDDFYGFTLDGDGRFLLDDFTVTHNSGKTVIAGHLMQKMIAKGRTCAFVVRNKTLVLQTSAHIKAIGIDHGIIAAGHEREARPNAPVQVCSAQTLTARNARPPADVIILDEAQSATCATSREIIAAYPDATIIGLTAWPNRSDGTSLHDVFHKLVQVRVPFRDLVAQGALVMPRVVGPKEAVAKLSEDPIVALRRYAPLAARRHKAVIFGESVAHARALAEQAARAGYRVACVDGKMRPEDVARDLARFNLPVGDAGALDLLTNCELLSEGWNAPAADVGILACRVGSSSVYIQRCGRFLRPFPGKTVATIVDLRGSSHELNLFPSDDVLFSFDADEQARLNKAALEALPTAVCCAACLAWHRGGGRPCPSCGACLPLPPPPKVSRRELVELRTDAAARRAASDGGDTWRAWCDYVQERRAKGKTAQTIAYAWRMSGKPLRFRVDQVPVNGYVPVLSAVSRGSERAERTQVSA